jgi:hypothetical protein
MGSVLLLLRTDAPATKLRPLIRDAFSAARLYRPSSLRQRPIEIKAALDQDGAGLFERLIGREVR